MNRNWIRPLAASLATVTTVSILTGIDALARHEATSVPVDHRGQSIARLASQAPAPVQHF